MIIKSKTVTVQTPFVVEIFEMLRLMAQASGVQLGGFCCIHPSIITKAGEGNAVWSACSARVSELCLKHPLVGPK